jgi:hypothetical protein
MPDFGGSAIATRDARARGPRYLPRGRHAAEAPVVPCGEVRSAAPAPIQFNWAAMRVLPIDAGSFRLFRDEIAKADLVRSNDNELADGMKLDA